MTYELLLPVLLLLCGAAAASILGVYGYRCWRRSRRAESVEELTRQKFTLAEASLKLLEQNETLSEKKRELEDQKLLLQTNKEMLQQQKIKLAEVNHKLFELNEELKKEKEKSEKLLLNILPPHVADSLKKQGYAEPEVFDNAAVMFTDFAGFTAMTALVPPGELIRELNELFTAFDNIIEKHHCERVKTIGDAYLAIGGVNVSNPHPVQSMLDAAAEIIAYLHDYNHRSKRQWHARIGIHTGSVVGGIVGIKKYIYDIFGDTVNTAARLEQHSEEMRINVSSAVCEAAGSNYRFHPREELEVKGKGKLKMFFLETQ